LIGIVTSVVMICFVLLSSALSLLEFLVYSFVVRFIDSVVNDQRVNHTPP